MRSGRVMSLWISHFNFEVKLFQGTKMSDPIKVNFAWSHKDVLSLAKQLNAKLEDKEALEILRHLEANFDKEVGMSNKIIRKAVQSFLESKGRFTNSKQQVANLDQVLSKKYKNSKKLPRIREFAGICQGIMYDEDVNEMEVEKLENWILSNIDLRDDKNVEEVYKIYASGRHKSRSEIAEELKKHFLSLYPTPKTDSELKAGDWS